MIPIEVHAAQPSEDEAFIADWRARVPEGGVLHRALRPDAHFRFVTVGAGEPYEVVFEEGDVDGAGGTILINPFVVPRERDEAFLSGWDTARAALAFEAGYLGTRLHRATGDARFRFVNIARWASPLAFQRAVQGSAAFREAAGSMGFEAHPALYEIVAV